MKQVKQLKRGIISVAAAVVLVACVSVQQTPTPEQELKALIEKTLPSSVPGAVVYVVKENDVVLEYAQGLADLSLQAPMQPNSSFFMGSVAKQFTAVAILRLQEQGKLSLTDPVTKWLQNFPAEYNAISLRHLLTHTSGIPNFLALPAWQQQARLPASYDQLHALYKDLPLQFAAGSAWNYSNSGYLILAHIVELASGQGFNEYLQQEVLGRGGVTQIWPYESDRIYPLLARGYIPHGHGSRPADFYDPSQVMGAGGLVATAQGLYQWTKALTAGEIISSASLNLAWQPYVLNSGEATSAGLGWEIGSVRGSRSIEHGGYYPGYFTFALWLPEEQVFVAAFVNSRSYDPQELAVRVAAQVVNKPYPALEPVVLSDSDINYWQGVWQDANGRRRVVGTLDGQLYIQRAGGSAFMVELGQQGYVHYQNSLSYLKRGTDAEGQWLELHNRNGLVSRSYRTQEMPKHYRTLALSPLQMAALEGEYTLAPEFSLRIFIDGDAHYAQGTGQNAGKLLALSEQVLVTDDLIAELHFERNENGEVTGLVLHQNGQTYPPPGYRIRWSWVWRPAR
ncbi:serine hydrolase [Aliidiomarina celeris]|uniref:serine hydrolase n=1 Tax=Aliidiomarina celeris TaxID=2249428 RepID=UPI000DEB89AF|nr:serine hydrolase [Aliidiomarina celeris]